MENEKIRCHPSIILEKSSGIITALFVIAMTVSGDEIDIILQEGDIVSIAWIVLGVIGVLSLILIYNIIIWSKTHIHIEENTIVIQRDTLNSKINTYGIQNISNVNLEQNIFERIVGTYKVKIDTDSLSTAESTDIEIVLSKKDAYEFKNKVLNLMNGQSNPSIDTNQNSDINIEDEDIDYDIVYSNNELLSHCFYNLSLGGLIFNLLSIAFIIFITYQIDDMEGPFMAFIMLGTGFIALGKFFIGDFFKYYNFCIKREKDKLFISYGLFKKNKFTVPVSRINAINIKQPTMSRMFKKYKSDIVTIGVGDDDSEGSQILLCSKKDKFIENMKILLPEINVEENIKLRKQPKSVYIISLFNITLGMVLVSLILYIVHKIFKNISLSILVIVGAFILIVMCTCAYMSYITKGINLREDSISLSFGIFSKNISIINYKKIQLIELVENPISIKFNLCKANIFILASLINSSRSLGYYDKNLYEELSNKVIIAKSNI